MKNINLIKCKVSPDMVGQDVLITPDTKLLSQMDYGEYNAASLRKFTARSAKQLRYLFAAFRIVADNKKDDENYNTVDKAKEQIKIKCRFFKTYIYYENKVTKEKIRQIKELIDKSSTENKEKIFGLLEQVNKNGNTLNIVTKSLSFAELEHLDACTIITEMLEECAELLGCTTEELEEQIKKEVGVKKICIFCGKTATQKHHMFSDSVGNNKKYGKKVIDADFNKFDACADCNSSHAGSELNKTGILHEREFDQLLLKQENARDLINLILDSSKRAFLRKEYLLENVKEKFDGEIIK